MRRIFACLLFFYAAWQILTASSTMQQYRGQGLAQIFWGLLATLGGIYLWRKKRKQ